MSAADALCVSTEWKFAAKFHGSCAVTNQSPNYPRLHVESRARSSAPPALEPTVAGKLCASYHDATGWPLKIEGSQSTIAEESARTASGSDPIELWKARELATSISRVVGELQRTREELWRREAELAVGVPVSARPREEEHLAIRLEAILQGAAQALGCQAAGLYLLDDATTQLKLRAAWGLAEDRFVATARPLADAFADLEAIVGHAVAIEDASLLPHWKIPEPFPAAVCVPVSSPTDPLGTLWFFANKSRDFTDEQTNLAEIVAGRIASELQREVLLNECVTAKRSDHQQLHATQWQRDHLPNVTPMLDGWQVAGWCADGDELANGFYDWFVPPDGSLAVVLGTGEGTVIESALSSAALQSAVRSHANYACSTSQLIDRVNETIWLGSAGGHFASLAYASIQPDSGELELAATGDISALVLQNGKLHSLSIGAIQLGVEPELLLQSQTFMMSHHDLVVLTSSMNSESQQARIAETIENDLAMTAAEMSGLLQETLSLPFGAVLRRV